MIAHKLSPAAAFGVAATGIAVFSAMDAVMKGLTLAIGVYNAMLWRSVAGVAIAGVLWVALDRRLPTRAALRLHLMRGAVGAVMALLFFWGLARIPIAQAITLAFVAPLIALFLAAVVLGERIGRETIVASAIAFLGVSTVLVGQARTGSGGEAFWGTLAVLASAVCYAVNIILMRLQSQLAGPLEVAFWQTGMVTLVLLLGAPWFIAPPPGGQLPAIVLGAALATISLLLLAWAYAHGEASYLAPTEYTAFIWAALFGWTVFGEPLSPWTLAGAVLIIAGCLIAARRRPVPLAEPIA